MKQILSILSVLGLGTSTVSAGSKSISYETKKTPEEWSASLEVTTPSGKQGDVDAIAQPVFSPSSRNSWNNTLEVTNSSGGEIAINQENVSASKEKSESENLDIEKNKIQSNAKEKVSKKSKEFLLHNQRYNQRISSTSF